MAVGAGEVIVETTDGAMRLYEARPEGDARAAVVVIMEAFGVNAHIEDVTRRAAEAGYHAVAPDLFHRSGGGSAPYDDFGKVMELFSGLTDDTLLTDVDAALDHLRSAGFGDDHLGIVGFCFGGRVTFLTAARRRIGAAVGFYGGGIVNAGGLPFPPLVDEVETMQTPWLGLFGDLDTGIPVDDVETLRTALDDRAPVETEVVRYPEAGHGFHCDGRPDSYHEASARDGWNRMLAWFGQHIG